RSQAGGAVNTARSLPLSTSGEGGLSGSVVVIVRVARVVEAARAGQADLSVAGASVGADHGPALDGHRAGRRGDEGTAQDVGGSVAPRPDILSGTFVAPSSGAVTVEG